MRILAIIIWLFINGVWGFIDAHRNNIGKRILLGSHLPSWIAKYMLAFLDILYVFYRGNPPYSWETVGAFLMFSASSWIWFDMTYNIFRFDVDWDHVGTTAWTDRFFHLFPDPFTIQVIAKCLMLAGGLFLYFYF